MGETLCMAHYMHKTQKLRKRKEEEMNYEIPAGRDRLLKKSREIARRFKLADTSSMCLLLCTFDAGTSVVTALEKMGINAAKMRQELESSLNRKSVPARQPQMMSDGDDAPDFDTDSLRIIKLSVLEDRLTGGGRDGALVIVLSILHDRDNEAKNFLQSYGVTYDKMVGQFPSRQAPRNDFTFPDETDSPYPEENKPQNNTSPRQKDKQKSSSDTPVIDNFGTNLTSIALKGGFDPVVGREREIERLIQVLCRRKKNNPIIIGEPGVGKSAIVEGLSDRIAHRRVPHLLLNKKIVALDMATIVAGTQYRGQFEERLRRLIQELKSHPDIILFIDEIHTIIGAGSAPGSLDAANILKPALARGEVQCIGATTTSEFKKSIEKDGALDRRFQKIMLEPTSAEETETILKNIKGHYERHHNVTYTDEALKACVRLTSRYITDRSLPDKAIDALDEAGARMHLSGNSIPKGIEEKEKEIERMREEKLHAAQAQNYEMAADLRDKIGKLTAELEQMTKEWQSAQETNPSVVNEDVVADVVSMMSGVPATRIAANESERLKGMKDALSKRVISQNKAIERLARAIMRSRIGLKGTDRPIGTFLFVGPTGVGKTHLVKCLAEWMFGTKESLIRIDMSEYGEKYSVSRLVGAPPGYVGYEEGGQLTERVRRHPYSVLLLDEIEKAHPDVFNTLLQVMDEGRMTDGNGTTVDFRNTIIILTSNSGTRQLREYGGGLGFERMNSNETTGEMAESIIKKALRKQFAPEFLNRLDEIIMFNPLTRDDAYKIADLELDDLRGRMEEKGYSIKISQEAKELIVEKGFDPQYGARSLKRAVQQELEDALCDYMMGNPEGGLLEANVSGGKIEISPSPSQDKVRTQSKSKI